MILTILLPYWGDVGFMKLSIQSVLRQTSEKWILIILDDDYPGTVIEDYVNSLSNARITYIRNVHNLGVNANFRKALDFVKTPYFVMFGSDDILGSDYVATALHHIKSNTDVSIFHPGVQILDEHGEKTKSLVDWLKSFLRPKDGVYSGARLAARLMIGNFTYFPSIIWKTDDVIKIGFRQNFHVTQDLAMLCDLILLDLKMLIFSDPIFYYRRHRNSDSSLKVLTGERFSEEIELSNVLAKSFSNKKWILAKFAALARPTVRLHMLLFLPKTISQPKIFLKTLRGVFLQVYS